MWVKGYELPISLMKEVHLMLYMQYLADMSMSKAAVEMFNAVAWIHSMSR